MFHGIAADSSGNAYVSGITSSSDFPTTAGAYDTTIGSTQEDGFVTKLNPTGTALVYSTFIGGTGYDRIRAIALDSLGNAYVSGESASNDYPATPGAYDTTNSGLDIVVTKLNAAGNALLYSTFIGGAPGETAHTIAVDPAGNAYVAGNTSGSGYPTTPGAYKTTHSGGSDAFLTKLNAAGSALLFSTFLGSTGEDWVYGLAVDSGGNSFLTGWTNSTSFPVTAGALSTIKGAGTESYVASFNPTGSALNFSTFLGGSGDDYGYGIAVDPAGSIHVSGTTYSSNFPISVGAYDTTYNNNGDMFYARLNPTGASLLYGTFIGSTINDWCYSLAIDSSGAAFLGGYTNGVFPTTPDAYSSTKRGTQDAVLAKFSPAGALAYSTFLGGGSDDFASSIAVDPAGAAYLSGFTLSSDFPTTTGAFDRTYGGNSTYDAFVAKFSFGPSDATPPIITVNATPGPNPNGWNNGPVSVTWTVTDPESAISSQSGCGPVTLSAQTTAAGTTLTCSATSAGGTASQSITIRIDLTPPVIAGSRTPAANANGWNNGDVNVAFTCSDALSGPTAPSASYLRSAEGANQSQAHTCTDLAGNTASTTVANISIDKTGPGITGSKTPAANANGWNNTDVNVAFTCSDPLSGPTVPTASYSKSAEGANQSQAHSCEDFAGNTSSLTVTNINIDKTVPLIAGSRTPAANANGWNNTDVNVAFTCSDPLSGPTAPSASYLRSAEGANQSQAHTCTDLAGNTASTTVADISIDKSGPGITGSKTPAANANGWNNTDVNVAFACTDALSGPTVPSASYLRSAEGANQSQAHTCTDLAGNTNSTTVTNISIDKTVPLIAGARTPAPNADGWNNTDVTVSFTCADALSGAVSAGASYLKSAEGAAQSQAHACQDLAGNASPLTISGISIDKTAPVVVDQIPNPNPVIVNAAISVQASLSDAGPSGLARADYRVNANPYAQLAVASGASATVSGPAGSFPDPSVAEICVKAFDLAGNASAEECRLVAAYDPNGGFVTGGGTFQSPAGALTAQPAATGRAQFAFGSKYLPGANVPSGNTLFKFKSANFEFNSTVYEWLVVAGARAQYKGDGVIKDVPGVFQFMLTAIDGQLPGGGGQDKFRLKITGPGGVVYDNQMGQSDNGNASTEIDGGSIVIHKK